MAGNNLFRSMLLQIVKVINFGYCKGVSESIFPPKNKIKKITLCSASLIQLLLYLRCMYWELSSHCWSFAGEFFCIAVILASSSFLTYHTQAAAALKEKILCFFFKAKQGTLSMPFFYLYVSTIKIEYSWKKLCLITTTDENSSLILRKLCVGYICFSCELCAWSYRKFIILSRITLSTYDLVSQWFNTAKISSSMSPPAWETHTICLKFQLR